MIQIDNSEAYGTISWILDYSNMGFYLVTAPVPMQRRIADLYRSPRVAVFDYSLQAEPYASAALIAWDNANQDAEVLFIRYWA